MGGGSVCVGGRRERVLLSEPHQEGKKKKEGRKEVEWVEDESFINKQSNSW